MATRCTLNFANRFAGHTTVSRPIRLLALLEAKTVTGPAKNVLEFAQRVQCLEPRPVEVFLATFERSGGNEFTAAALRAGLTVRVIPERFVGDPRMVPQLRSIAREVAPDILQTHAVKSHFVMYLSGLWRSRPWVASHHGYTTTDIKMRGYNLLDRVSFRAPHKLLTVSQAFQRQLSDRGVAADRITVLHNAVDPAWGEAVRALDRAAVRRRLGIGERESVVLAVGRLSPEKGHVHLFAAVKQLRQAGFPIRLIVLGVGPMRAALERSAGEGVHFLGHVPDPSMYYAAGDLLAVSSLSEGSPNALLEALAAGLPIVATSVGGIPEIVRDYHSALLVEPRNPEALATAIRRLLEDPELATQLAAEGLSLAGERHSPEAHTRTLVDLYESLL